MRARFIIEGANGPITRRRTKFLEASSVTVVPDILANAGGVVVSYFSGCRTCNPSAGERTMSTTCSEAHHAYTDEVWALAAKEERLLRMGAYMSLRSA